ncbi:MAG: SIS domain-containing protein [Ruthenibacterium sp.]
MENINCYDNALRRQVFSIPELFENEFDFVKQRVKTLVEQLAVQKIENVIITGCGDSFCAGVFSKDVFEKVAHLYVEPISALNLSRYYPCELMKTSLRSTLVIGISNSGRVPRVAEAIARMKINGAITLALTSDRTSPLADAAQFMLSTKIPHFEKSPGVRGYIITMLCLFWLAVCLAMTKGKIDSTQVACYEKEIALAFKNLKNILPKFDETAYKISTQFSNAHFCEFIGSGHAYGTAIFAREKMYEAVGIASTVCDAEEWFHSFKFLKNFENMITLVFADCEDAGNSRTSELIERLMFMEREFVLVANGRVDVSKFEFTLSETKYNFLLPFVEFAPPVLIASYLAAIRQEPYSRAFTGRWSDREGVPSTVASKIEIW